MAHSGDRLGDHRSTLKMTAERLVGLDEASEQELLGYTGA